MSPKSFFRTIYCFFAVFVSFLLLPTRSLAQAFTPLSSGAGVFNPSCGWADFNNDGFLDMLVTGSTGSSIGPPSGQGRTFLYQNLNGTDFADVQATQIANLPALNNGSVAWADYNQDGYQDFVISGNTPSSQKMTLLYQNQGPSQGYRFVRVEAVFKGINQGNASWADVNKDGYPDLFLGGSDSLNMPVSLLYLNGGQKNGFGFTPLNASLMGLEKGGSSWADYNHDGWDDLVISGSNPTYSAGGGLPYQNGVTLVYTNLGNNTFAQANFSCNPDGAGNTGYSGNAEWGDFDNDGYADILSVGVAGSGGVWVYRNNRDGSFSPLQNSGLPPVVIGRGRWGDYNNDGKLDIAITGYMPTGDGLFRMLGMVYVNNGNGRFSAIDNPGLAMFMYSDMSWGDLDNDGDLDLFIAGTNINEHYCNFYLNNQNAVCQPLPAATTPTGLKSYVFGNQVFLKWDALADLSLSYNINIGNSPSNQSTFPSESNPANGQRRVVKAGNVGRQGSLLLNDLPPGTYYWSVQSVNSAWQGSPFAAQGSFSVPGLSSAAVIKMEGASPFCAGNGPTLTAYAYPLPSAWQWYLNGNILSGANVQTLKVVSPGSYTVVASGTEKNGSLFSVTSAPITVTAQPLVQVPTSSDAIACAGSQVALKATPGANGNDCKWYENGNLLATNNYLNVKPTVTTTYQVYSFNSQTGCQSPYSTNVTATINPLPEVPIVNPNVMVCDSSPVVLTATVQPGMLCLWTTSVNDTATVLFSGNTFVIPSVTQGIRYYVKAQDPATQCKSGFASVYVSVVPTLGPPTVPNAYSCNGSPVTLHAHPGSNANSCNWYTEPQGGTPIFTGIDFTTPPVTRDLVYFVASTRLGTLCESASRTPVKAEAKPIFTQPYVQDQVGYVKSQGQSVSIKLVARTGARGTTCKWYSGANKSGYLATGETYIAKVSSTKTFYVSTFDANTGCESDSMAAVKAMVQVKPFRSLNPDQVYPVASIPGEESREGVNLCTGDVIKSFPLGAIQAGEIGFSLQAQYNSRSAAVQPYFTANPLGGNGWKLLDYPKIVYDDVLKKYFYLDGNTVSKLDSFSKSNNKLVFRTSGEDWMNQFTQYIQNPNMAARNWKVTDGKGMVYYFSATATSSLSDGEPGNIWNLSKICDSQGQDSLQFTYSPGGVLQNVISSNGDRLDVNMNGAFIQNITLSRTGPGGSVALSKIQLRYAAATGPLMGTNILSGIALWTNAAIGFGAASQWALAAPETQFYYTDPNYPGALSGYLMPEGGSAKYSYGDRVIEGNLYHPVTEVNMFTGTTHRYDNKTVPENNAIAMEYHGGRASYPYILYNKVSSYPGAGAQYLRMETQSTSFETGSKDPVFKDATTSNISSDIALTGNKSYFFNGVLDDVLLSSKRFALTKTAMALANDTTLSAANINIGEAADTVVVEYYVYDSQKSLTLTHHFGHNFYDSKGKRVDWDSKRIDTENGEYGQWVRVIQKLAVPRNAVGFDFVLMGGSAIYNYDFYLDNVTVSGASFAPQGREDVFFFNGSPADSLLRLPDAYREAYQSDSISQAWFTAFEPGEDLSKWLTLNGGDGKPVIVSNTFGHETSYAGSGALNMRARPSNQNASFQTKPLPIPQGTSSVRVAFRYSRAQIKGMKFKVEMNWTGGALDTTITLGGSYLILNDYSLYFKEFPVGPTAGNLTVKVSVTSAGTNTAVNNFFIDNFRVVCLTSAQLSWAPKVKPKADDVLLAGKIYCSRMLKNDFTELHYLENCLYPIKASWGSYVAAAHTVLNVEHGTALTYNVLKYNSSGLPEYAIKTHFQTDSLDNPIVQLSQRKLTYAPDLYPQLGRKGYGMLMANVLEENMVKHLGDSEWQVSSSMLTEWKNFSNNPDRPIWEPWRTFSLQAPISTAALDSIPARIVANPAYTPDARWKKINEVLQRNGKGMQVLSMGQDSIPIYTQYSGNSYMDAVTGYVLNNSPVPMAAFVNATSKSAFYEGFESYQKDLKYQSEGLSNVNVFTGNASAKNTVNLGFGFANSTKENHLYVFDGRVLPQASSVRFQVTGTLSGTLLDKTLHFPDSLQGNWQYFEMVFPIVAASDSLTFTITPSSTTKITYTDDLRFSPTTGNFSAMVYELTSGRVTAKIGNNSDYQRLLFNSKGEQIGAVKTGEVPIDNNSSYLSRSGQKNKGIYQTSDPNATCNIVAKGGGICYGFNSPGQLSNWSLAGDITVGNTGLRMSKNATATLLGKNLPRDLNNFGVAFQFVPDFSRTNQCGFTFSLGQSKIYISIVPESNISVQFINGRDQNTSCLLALPFPLHNTYPIDVEALFLNGKVLLWVDGHFVPVSIPYIFGNNPQAQFKCSASVTILKNVRLLLDPLVSLVYSDGLGNPMQTQTVVGNDLIVSETLFDGMLRPAVVSKDVRLVNQAPGYLADFISSFDWITGVMQGQVDKAHDYCEGGSNDNGYFYYRTVYEGSPETSVKAEFQAGKDFALRTYSNWEKSKRWVYDHQEQIIQAAAYAVDLVTIILAPEEAPLILVMDAADLLISHFSKSEKNTDKEVAVTKYYYDARLQNKQIKLPKANFKKNPKNNQVVNFGYDFQGNNTMIETPESGKSTSVYDAFGRIRFTQDAVQAAAGKIMYNQYDRFGRITEAGYFLGTWSESSLKAAANKNYPGAAQHPVPQRKYSYDGVDNGFPGKVTCRGRLTSAFTFENGAQHFKEDYFYNPEGQLVSMFKLLNHPNIGVDSFFVNYAYDNLGNTIAIEYPQWDSRPFRVAYSYNKMNLNDTIRTNTDGLLLAIEWNPDGSIHKKRHYCNTGTPFPGIYSYNAPGWNTNIFMGDSTAQHYVDANGYPHTYYLPANFNLGINYNFLDGWWNNLWGVAYYNGSISSQHYKPGPNTRLKEHKQGFNYNDYGAMDSYYSNIENEGIDAWDTKQPVNTEFDANGNIMSKTIEEMGKIVTNGRKYKYHYNNNHNRLDKVYYAEYYTNGKPNRSNFDLNRPYYQYDTLSFVYNKNGNASSITYRHFDHVNTENGKGKLLYQTVRTFHFNESNLLANASLIDSKNIELYCTFLYDPSGARFVKEVQYVKNHSPQAHYIRTYIRGIDGRSLAERTHSLDGGRDTMNYYVTGPDGSIVAMFQRVNATQNSWFILSDNRGSAVQMVNRADKSLVAAWGYTDYGKLVGGLLRNPEKFHYLYTGQEYDAELGLYNYKARMFDPGLNIFLSPDPAMPDPASPYAYVGNDPINNVDPSGMVPVELAERILAAYRAERMGARDAARVERILANPPPRIAGKRKVPKKLFGLIPYQKTVRTRNDCLYCTILSEMKDEITPRDLDALFRQGIITRNFEAWHAINGSWSEPHPSIAGESVLLDPYPGYNPIERYPGGSGYDLQSAIGYMKTFENGTKFSIGGEWVHTLHNDLSSGHAFKAEVFKYEDRKWVIFRDFQMGGEPMLKPYGSDRVIYEDINIYKHQYKFGENGF